MENINGKFKGEDLIQGDLFTNYLYIIKVLLDPKKYYTESEVQKIIDDFLKKEVK